MNSFINEHPNASDEELHKQILNDHEDKIYYRAISPRIFESAIFRNLMILYEGKYQSVIEPGKHYLELKKDFSNIDEILKKIRDPKIYEEITDRAYKDLILSGDYSYRGFIEDFCKKVGIKSVGRGVINKNKILYFPAKRRKIALRVYSMIRSKFNFNFYGRDYLRKKVHKIMGIQKDRFLFK